MTSPRKNRQRKKKACLSAKTLRHAVRVFLLRLASPQPFRESEKSESAAECGLRSALFRCKVAAVGDAFVLAGGLLARDAHFLQTCPAGFGGVYARTVCGFDKTAKEPKVFMEAMKRAVRPAKTNVDNKKSSPPIDAEDCLNNVFRGELSAACWPPDCSFRRISPTSMC